MTGISLLKGTIIAISILLVYQLAAMLRQLSARNLSYAVHVAKTYLANALATLSTIQAGSNDPLERKVRELLEQRRLERVRTLLMFSQPFAVLMVSLFFYWKHGRDSVNSLSHQEVIALNAASITVLALMLFHTFPKWLSSNTIYLLYWIVTCRMLYTILNCHDAFDFYLLVPGQAFSRLCMSLCILDVRRTSGVNVALCIAHCVAYTRSAQTRTFIDDALPSHVNNYVVQQIAGVLLTTTVSWYNEASIAAEIRASLILYDAEKNTAMEKEASEAILAAVCDATFWLSEDGDRIHKSSVKLEAMLGPGLEGKCLSKFMVDNERLRFQDTIAAGKVPRARNAVVRSVPTRFMHPAEQSITADLFVVDRCVGPRPKLKSCGSPRVGFFVGLRLSQLYDMGCPAAEMPVVAPRIGEQIRSPGERSLHSSVARASDHVFEMEERNAFINAVRNSSSLSVSSFTGCSALPAKKDASTSTESCSFDSSCNAKPDVKDSSAQTDTQNLHEFICPRCARLPPRMPDGREIATTAGLTIPLAGRKAVPSDSQSASSADSVAQRLRGEGGAMGMRDSLGGAVDSTMEKLTTLQNETTRGGMHKVRDSALYTRYKFYKVLRNTLRQFVEEMLIQTVQQMHGDIARSVEPSERSPKRALSAVLS